MLPVVESQIKLLHKTIKEECYRHFKKNTLGDIQNSKNKAYMDKLKAEFKATAVRVKKKNDDLIQKISAQILDQLFALAAKQKNYQSIHDVQADIQYISQEYQN